MVVKKFVLIISFLFVAVGLLGLTQIVRAQTLKDLVGQVNLLQDQLNKILEQTPRSWCYSFQKDLSKGATGPEVRILQAALEQEGFVIASQEKTSNYFGASTLQAVISFQEKYQSDILAPLGLTSGTGYLGSSTRTKLNQLYGCPTTATVISESAYKCPDINGDGTINGTDVIAVSRAFSACIGNTSYNSAADFNGDGCVNQIDNDFVAKFFGQSTNTIAQCGGIPNYSLTIAVSGQGTTSPVTGTYTYRKGEQVTISANPGSGWDFSSWQGADNNSTNPTTVTITTNKTVTALFTKKSTPTPGCTDADKDGYYAYNSAYCTTGNDCNDNNPNVHPGAKEICNDNLDNDCNGLIDSADPICKQLELTYKCPDINGDGTINGSDVIVVSRAFGTCIGNTSYNPVADMDGDGCVTQTDTNFVSKFSGQSTNTITQCGGITYFSLSLAVNGQGTTSPVTGTYNYRKGQQVTISANPGSGWYFSSWQGADNNSTNPTTVTITANKTVTALFKQKLAAKTEPEYKCPDINGDGKVDGMDVVTVSRALGTCQGNTGYNSAVDMDGDECITQTDSNFVSKFSGQSTNTITQCGGIPRYSLTIAVSGQGTTSPVIGTYTYRQGEQVTITATPTPGWDFSSWQGADNNSTNPTTVTITTNKTVTALFKLKPESAYKCPDINGDGTVNGMDVVTVSRALGACMGNTSYNPATDFNGDGCVNQTDNDFVVKFFGQNVSQIAQCKTTSSLQTLSSMIASMTDAISKIAEQLKEFLK